MNVNGQGFDPLAQLFHKFRQLRILLHQLDELPGLLCGILLALFARQGKGLPVLRVGIGVRLIAVRLPSLSKQDERGGVGCLETEGKIQKDKGK